MAGSSPAMTSGAQTIQVGRDVRKFALPAASQPFKIRFALRESAVFSAI